MDSLKRFRALADDKNCEAGLLVCRVEKERPLPFGVTAMPWREFPAWLAENV